MYISQLYYPSFKESTIYLRFLDELLHTLNKEDEISQPATDSSSSNPASSDNNPSSHTQVASLAAHIAGRDWDDPDSLYDRPCLLWVSIAS